MISFWNNMQYVQMNCYRLNCQKVYKVVYIMSMLMNLYNKCCLQYICNNNVIIMIIIKYSERDLSAWVILPLVLDKSDNTCIHLNNNFNVFLLPVMEYFYSVLLVVLLKESEYFGFRLSPVKSECLSAVAYCFGPFKICRQMSLLPALGRVTGN